MTQVRQREAQRIFEAAVARYQMYPAYRDSGVEWLGEIPAHWEVWKMGYAYKNIGSGTTPNTDNLDYYDGDVHWVTTSELRESVIEDTTVKLTPTALKDHSALKIYPPGTLLIAMYGATIGRLGILGVHACTNQACCAMTQSSVLNTKYTFYYLLHSRNEIINLSSGGGQPNINQEKIYSLKLTVPPPDEQRAIAAFLDRQTAKIDALIAKKRELTAALHEKRSAIISHAVTKGLNPDAPMKDSGIEWLGAIPAGWRLLKFKRVMRWIEQGWSPQAEGRPADDEEWGVLKVGCVNYGRFEPTENKALLSDTEPITRYEIYKGDLLVSRANTRELLGSAAVVGDVRSRLLLCDKLFRIHLRQDWVLPEFAALALTSSNARYQIEREATGASASMQNVGQDTLFNLMLPLPNLSEQRVIVNAVNKELIYIDKIIMATETTIERLQEYRAALISAAVTGKIDVRGG